MNLSAYLNRVNYPSTPSVSTETLTGLHRAHTLTVPFENLDVIRKVPIRLDPQRFYIKIVENNRGGFCYEMNGLFKQVLDEIGFESWFISCNVYVPALDIYGTDYGHVALITRVDEELYLVDVGFGDAFIEPLKLDFALPRLQYGTWYRFTQLPDEEVLLEKSADGENYTRMFKFKLTPRAFSEFAELCQFHQVAPQAPFNKQPLCSRPTPEGRITLTGTSLTITKNGIKQEEVVQSEAEFDEKLMEYFGISREAGATVPA